MSEVVKTKCLLRLLDTFSQYKWPKSDLLLICDSDPIFFHGSVNSRMNMESKIFKIWFEYCSHFKSRTDAKSVFNATSV